jgi:hypothetical protein
MAYLWLEEVRQPMPDLRRFRCSRCLETYDTENLTAPFPKDVVKRFDAHNCSMVPQEHSGPQAIYWGVTCKGCVLSATVVLKEIQSAEELDRAIIPVKFSAYCEGCGQAKSYEKNDVRIVRANTAVPPFEPHKDFVLPVTA